MMFRQTFVNAHIDSWLVFLSLFFFMEKLKPWKCVDLPENKPRKRVNSVKNNPWKCVFGSINGAQRKIYDSLLAWKKNHQGKTAYQAFSGRWTV